MEGIKAQFRPSKGSRKSDLELSKKTETGFPSPAADHLEKALNLEELVVLRPSATFYVRAQGNAMQQSGIHDGDVLVVDRSIIPKHGQIVIASIEGEPIIRRLVKMGSRFFLLSDSQKYEPIAVSEETNWMIWGVVTFVIHRFKE